MRLSATKNGAISTGRGLGNELWDKAGTAPSLDLQFADNKSLADATTGSNLVTFTRASSGTYVDSEGVIRTATTNLLLRSEEFQTTWSPFNITVSTDTSTSPTGSLTADTITPAASTAAHLISQTATVVASTPCTASVYIKSDGAPFVQVVFDNGSSVGAFINVNTSTGAITRGPDLAGGATNATGSVVSAGNGWYRVSVGATHSGTIGRILISPLPAASSTASINPSTTTAATDKVLLWGAQLEQSATVGEYIPTTSTINSAPRFDHDPTTGESLGLLVEEARTNLSQQSEDFSNVYWTKTDCTITANDSTAPDGTTTADLWTNVLSGGGAINNSITKDATARTYTSSMWVKGTVSLFTLTLDFGGTANRGRVQFNLVTNTVIGTTNTGNFTGTSGSITVYPNGWARLIMTTTTSTGTTIRFRPFFGTGGESVHIWGAQVEEGSFPTSYIPTSGSSATRTQDNASISGASFNNFYNQTEGTIVSRFKGGRRFIAPSSTQNWSRVVGYGSASRALLSSGNTGNNNIHIYNGTQTFDIFLGPDHINGFTTAAVGFGSNSATLADAGYIAETVANGWTTPTVDKFVLGNDGSGQYPLNGYVRRLTYWPVRLSNEVLQRITQ